MTKSGEETVIKEPAYSESRAERTVEVEEQLKAARDRTDGVSPTVIDLEAEIRRDTLRQPQVLGFNRVGEDGETNLVVSVELDGTEERFNLPWPDDPTDPQEPVVRLCRWYGVHPERIGDIDRVSVVRESDGWKLLLPPKQRSHRFAFRLSGGRTVTVEPTTASTYLRRASYRALHMALATNLAKPFDEVGQDFDMTQLACVALIGVIVVSILVSGLALGSVFAGMGAAMPVGFVSIFLVGGVLWGGGAELIR